MVSWVEESVQVWRVGEWAWVADQQQLLVVHGEQSRQPLQCQPEQRQRQQQQRQQQQLRDVCALRVTPDDNAVSPPHRFQS